MENAIQSWLKEAKKWGYLFLEIKYIYKLSSHIE